MSSTPGVKDILEQTRIQAAINQHRQPEFRLRCSGQCEHIARKLLENLHQSILGGDELDAHQVHSVVQSVALLLELRDRYAP